MRVGAARRATGSPVGAGLAALLGALVGSAALVGPSLPAAALDPTAAPGSTASASATASAGTPSPTGTTDPTGRTAQKSGRQKASKAEQAADAEAAAEAKDAADAKAAAEAKDEARKAAEAAHDTAALMLATAALADAEAALGEARATLKKSTLALEKAEQVDRAAQLDLQSAVLAAQRANRDLVVVEGRIAVRERDLGRLAHAAYINNGSMGEWAVVLSSTTADQLADRLAFLQSVGSAGNAVLAALREDRADLLNAKASLEAAREREEESRENAATALGAVRASAEAAKVAKAQVDVVVELRRTAVEEAEAAVKEDRRRYRVMTEFSGALASRLVDLAVELAGRTGGSVGTGAMMRPGTGEITSSYGPRFHPILKYVKVHTGTDFAAADGIAYAADDGVVVLTEVNEAYGNMTVIDHGSVGGQRLSTLYAHQAAFGVEPGDRVFKGQPIGIIGSTGFSTGPHLHFEVRLDGQPVDPTPFLAGAALPTAPGAPHGAAAGSGDR